tara:strand:- start:92 stop:673 length:582 start_codon:yes stop_codon:yes gene_type:complete
VKEFLFFSGNNFKIKEVKKILENDKLKILTLNDFPLINEPKETGKTFAENALIKSSYGYKKFGFPCFADDSGICISALNNKPGIKSKRYQERNGGFEKTFEIIINETKRKKDFKAYFQTSIVLTLKKNKVLYFDGIVFGKISNKPIGSYGFHYDPIFIPNGYIKTYAEMTIDEKNIISHRSVAINKLKKYLEN